MQSQRRRFELYDTHCIENDCGSLKAAINMAKKLKKTSHRQRGLTIYSYAVGPEGAAQDYRLGAQF